MDGLDGWDLCARLLYEHRFAVLINYLKPHHMIILIYNLRDNDQTFDKWAHYESLFPLNASIMRPVPHEKATHTQTNKQTNQQTNKQNEKK